MKNAPLMIIPLVEFHLHKKKQPSSTGWLFNLFSHDTGYLAAVGSLANGGSFYRIAENAQHHVEAQGGVAFSCYSFRLSITATATCRCRSIAWDEKEEENEDD
ncbi:hypothetical protein NZD89_04740 [Alicyclobacillus fastidiosus]|uniref:Uncharacterized protein n=1 Tax=Alicyclobacillus fastidiosus TaxID=392011 RepID=A0ABY6ZPK8_9BACL|nr:hypothetical protein [Alicyclobacillus fastidiosus]WAH44769.1 hypothetical protein NZD89_04740 [Alicyclobacillus fastidiosus]